MEGLASSAEVGVGGVWGVLQHGVLSSQPPLGITAALKHFNMSPRQAGLGLRCYYGGVVLKQRGVVLKMAEPSHRRRLAA